MDPRSEHRNFLLQDAVMVERLSVRPTQHYLRSLLGRRQRGPLRRRLPEVLLRRRLLLSAPTRRRTFLGAGQGLRPLPQAQFGVGPYSG